VTTAAPDTWQARTEIVATPAEVLDALTDPESCGRWSPIDFELEELGGGRRLVAGSRARVSGRLPGAPMAFDVEVFEANPGRLRLRASGPVVLDVDYALAPLGQDATEVTASVTVRRSAGLLGGALQKATRAVLATGVLDRAVAAIAELSQGGSNVEHSTAAA
jgi:hypothetical protein